MIGHRANKACLPLPEEKVCVCRGCAWKWIEFLAKDPCKKSKEHYAEATTIMNKEAIITCPRRMEAKDGIRTYLSASPSPRTSMVKKNIFAMLCEKFPESPHHEDYGVIVKKLIEELIRTKQVIQQRRRLLRVIGNKKQ